jgi:hypothetical protein
MIHLSPEVFVDLLDGTVAETAVAHLAECHACRQQLEELRGAWQAASDAEMPEPSPLFWEYFRTRVHDAVAAEPVRPAVWWRFRWSWSAAGLATAGAVALVVALQVARGGPGEESPVGAMAPASQVADAGVAGQPVPLPEDESLGFVVDLASNVDWDSVSEFGFASHGDAERALVDMDNDERAELQRLLTDALSRGSQVL